ncbi:MAG: hypothetical protein M1834_000781 [Cirrosporium novae-zelandiae]|nr:MAG: hypothetical protein M1834_000781 [Cirrosporium novae-zelandiae]
MTTFYPNCTIPPHTVNYVSAPNTRGTLQILWSCLSVLLLFSWTAQHLNVPLQSTPQNWKQKLRRRIWRFHIKIKWMIITLIAPEFIAFKAASDFISARKLKANYKDFAAQDSVSWSISHTFLANMGGFAVQFIDDSNEPRKYSLDPEEGGMNPDKTRDREQIDENQEGRGPDSIHQENASSSTRSINSRTLPAGGQKELSSEPKIAQPVNSKIKDVEPTTTRGPSSYADAFEDDYHDNEPQGASNRRPFTLWMNRRTILPSNDHSDSNIPLEDMISPLPEAPNPSPYRLNDALTAQIQKNIQEVSDDPGWDRNACFQANTRDAKAIGEINWRMDAENTRLTDCVLREIKLGHFSDQDEREIIINFRSWYRNLIVLQGNIWVLDASQLLFARKRGIIETLPAISEDELDDRTKSNFLAKGLAICQAMWLTVQIILRSINDHETSQLEYFTIGFASYTFLIYGSFWNKPQGITMPIYINASRRPTITELAHLAMKGPIGFYNSFNPPRHWIPNLAFHRRVSKDDVIRTSPKLFILGAFYVAAVFAYEFGFSWVFQFPTLMEKLLWRISYVISISVPIIIGLTLGFRKRTKSPKRYASLSKTSRVSIGIFTKLGLGIYILARLYITVEIFRTFCYLPPDAFRTTWASSIPHIG